MEKDSAEMDLEDWEILPKDGYWRTSFNPKKVIDVNYLQPSLLSPQRLKTTEEGDGNQLDQMLETTRLVPQTVISPKLEAEQEVITQAVLNQEKQKQFVDMIMDSGESNNQAFEPQPEVGRWQFKKEDGHEQAEDRTSKAEAEQGNRKKYMDSAIKDKGCWEGCSLNIWKWGVPGIGALCSIGVAAATICVLILGGNQSKQQKNQILQFQISNDDKSMNQAVHHATGLKQAISTATVPFTRARFTSGGSYVSP